MLEERNAVCNALGLFSLSQLGEIEVRGPQAIDLVSVFRDRVAKFLGKFERKQREEALSLPETLTAPDGVNLAGIKKAIETRGA